MADRQALRSRVRALLQEYAVSFRQAGDEALDFEITDDETVVLRFDDGEEELDPDEVEDRISEYADGLGAARHPPGALAAFESMLADALVDHLDDDHDEDADDDDCCYDALESAVEDIDLEELELEEVDRLRFEDDDGTVWRVVVDGDTVRLDDRDQDDEDDDDDYEDDAFDEDDELELEDDELD